jgi:hypothetical protein
MLRRRGRLRQVLQEVLKLKFSTMPDDLSSGTFCLISRPAKIWFHFRGE